MGSLFPARTSRLHHPCQFVVSRICWPQCGGVSEIRTELVRTGAALHRIVSAARVGWLKMVLVFFRGLRYQSAMTNASIDQLARRLAESLPQGVRSMRDELEHNFRSILQSGLARLDLVTREEFEIQESVLARTRAKLEGLEQRLQSLEAAPAPKPASKKPAKKAAAKKAPAKKSSAKKPAKAAKKKAAKKKT